MSECDSVSAHVCVSHRDYQFEIVSWVICWRDLSFSWMTGLYHFHQLIILISSSVRVFIDLDLGAIWDTAADNSLRLWGLTLPYAQALVWEVRRSRPHLINILLSLIGQVAFYPSEIREIRNWVVDRRLSAAQSILIIQLFLDEVRKLCTWGFLLWVWELGLVLVRISISDASTWFHYHLHQI